MTLFDFFKKKYYFGDERYNPHNRAKDIEDVLNIIKRDGLKVSCKNNCIYIENTISKDIAKIQFSENGSIKLDI